MLVKRHVPRMCPLPLALPGVSPGTKLVAFLFPTPRSLQALGPHACPLGKPLPAVNRALAGRVGVCVGSLGNSLEHLALASCLPWGWLLHTHTHTHPCICREERSRPYLSFLVRVLDSFSTVCDHSLEAQT